MTRPVSGRVAVFSVAAMLAAVAFERGVTGYGAVALAVLAVKVVAAWRFAPAPYPTGPGRRRIVVVVPGYNEDPGLWSACLRSIAEQTVPPVAVFVVDDGSPLVDLAVLAELERPRFQRAGIRLVVDRFPRNRGKREALAAGFRAGAAWQPDVFVTVDSDTILDGDCVAYLSGAFDDPRVTAATAMVGASNRRGLLARMLDVRYSAAFAVDRGWQSAFGATLCCCGSAAAYRADIVARRVDEFAAQTFRGKRCTYGDDRRFTALALLDGRVVAVGGAHATTAVPERFGHWARQQVRWNRSWVRETLLLIGEQPMSRPAFWLGVAEASTWVAFSAMLAVSVFVVVSGGDVLAALPAVVFVTIARSAPYVDRRDVSRRDRLLGLLMSPLYGVVHLVVVAVGIRVWALLTLSEPEWGTRDRVEVSI